MKIDFIRIILGNGKNLPTCFHTWVIESYLVEYGFVGGSGKYFVAREEKS